MVFVNENFSDPLPHSHFGAFCRDIRKSLQIDIQPLANQYQIVHTLLSRNFESNGNLPRKDIFDKYLKGLQTKEFSKKGRVLSRNQAGHLEIMYEKEDKAKKQQTEETLQNIDLETIISALSCYKSNLFNT